MLSEFPTVRLVWSTLIYSAYVCLYISSSNHIRIFSKESGGGGGSDEDDDDGDDDNNSNIQL